MINTINMTLKQALQYIGDSLLKATNTINALVEANSTHYKLFVQLTNDYYKQNNSIEDLKDEVQHLKEATNEDIKYLLDAKAEQQIEIEHLKDNTKQLSGYIDSLITNDTKNAQLSSIQSEHINKQQKKIEHIEHKLYNIKQSINNQSRSIRRTSI